MSYLLFLINVVDSKWFDTTPPKYNHNPNGPISYVANARDKYQ